MKLVSLAIGSLGIWVFLNALLSAESTWEDIVFGLIAALLAIIGAFRVKEAA